MYQQRRTADGRGKIESGVTRVMPDDVLDTFVVFKTSGPMHELRKGQCHDVQDEVIVLPHD